MLDQDIDELASREKIDFAKSLLVDYQRDNEDKMDTSCKGQSWTDEQLEIILTDAPTKDNCVRFARLFKRGYGSIEQIYRWAATPSKTIKDKGREEDIFIKQVKRIAKKSGL